MVNCIGSFSLFIGSFLPVHWILPVCYSNCIGSFFPRSLDPSAVYHSCIGSFLPVHWILPVWDGSCIPQSVHWILLACSLDPAGLLWQLHWILLPLFVGSFHWILPVWDSSCMGSPFHCALDSSALYHSCIGSSLPVCWILLPCSLDPPHLPW